MIMINDVKLPNPSEMAVTISDYDASSDTVGRNSQGELFRDRVCIKRKIDLTWKLLTAEQMALILNAVEDVFFTVTYYDPKDGEKTITGYVGDRTPSLYTFSDIGILYKDFSMSITER